MVVELEAFRESPQLGLEQRTRDELLLVDRQVEVGSERLGLRFVYVELRRGGCIQGA